MITMHTVRELKKFMTNKGLSFVFEGRNFYIAELCEIIERQQEALKYYARQEQGWLYQPATNALLPEE